LIKEGDFLIAEEAKPFQFYNCFAPLRQSGWIFSILNSRFSAPFLDLRLRV